MYLGRLQFYKKILFRFKNDKEKTKNETIVFSFLKRSFLKTTVFEDNPLLTTINNDPLLSTINDDILLTIDNNL